MSDVATARPAREPALGYWRHYIFSVDHKTIGQQYLTLSLLMAVLGGATAYVMRWQLAWPGSAVPLTGWLPESLAYHGMIDPAFYNQLVTMHGTIMIFFVAMPMLLGGLGNVLVPLMVGAPDMAFPRLNMLSFWTTFVGLVVIMSTFFVGDGPPISGWTAYPPLSAVGGAAGPGQAVGQNLWVISIAIFCVASMLGALNFIATTLDLRARGLSLLRLPLTCWSWFITAILSLLSFAVLLAAGALLLLDRMGGTSFFVPGGLIVSDKIIPHTGGSPLLWQHLFWFFGHPEVYIAILPGMGVTSHVISTFSRKPIFGYKAMVAAMLLIGFLGFMVWGHHMFVSGMSPYSAFAFSVLTMAIAVPSAIKTFNWLGTILGGKLRFATPMLFSLGFVSLFVTGGLSGIFLGQPAIDIYFHDTYFVLAHFHMIMGVAAIFGIFTGTYFWFPKMFGRMMNETLGKLHFWFTFVGVYAIFMPMHFLGLVGHPRRYSELTGFEFLKP